MISFAMTDEQETARERHARLRRPRRCARTARECDEASAIPDAFFAQAWELGLTATQLPEAFGGYGAPRSPVTNAIVLEELAYGDAALAVAAAAPSLFAYAIADQGSDDAARRATCRPSAASATTTGVAGGHRAAPGFDAFAPRTGAERNGKRLRAQRAASASCRSATAPATSSSWRAPATGLDAFIVPRDAAGLTIAAPEKNLGLKALPTGTPHARRRPRRRRPIDSAAAPAPTCRGCSTNAASALAAILNGLSRAVLDYCVPYAKERVAFGEPIARKQSIAFRLAEMQMEVESMRWMIWKAASQLEHGLDATRSAHLARAYAAEKAMWISDNGVQVLGGHGFIREHPVEMWYRNARTLGVLEGLAAV